MAYDILVVDDEKDIRELISGILEDEGYETRTAESGYLAIEQIRLRQPHLVILDVWLGDSEHDGLKILEEIKRDLPFVPVIMISGHATISTAVSAIKKGAYDFIEKPFQTDKLLITIERAIESSRLKRENESLKKYEDINLNLIGSTPVVNRLKQDVEKASANNWRIFFSGPSGSGKEQLAKCIHERSSKSGQPFIVVNCAHIFPHELEAELFGAEFDLEDDRPRRIGLIEQAHQGTLFFSEITALPLPVQAKITKLLVEEQFSRLGSNQKIKVNIRFMASSSQNIQDLIGDGHFREDLFYRLNVLSIQVPALKERSSDLKIMISTVCDQYAKRYGCLRRSFSEDAIAFLQVYSWPNNLSELKNIVEWTLISVQDKQDTIITKEMLPMDLLQASKNILLKKSSTSELAILPIKEAREIFERDYLQAQINRFSGNITQTSRFVGMERSALHRKLKLLGITDSKDDQIIE
ncbi:MAG: sigma-54-dependent Fis family transcriptional regulator [Proteobacteria bacterium]|nr:sigma-54-dependent Fis family transcriptional regulator [Pseudomonadota bacterium]